MFREAELSRGTARELPSRDADVKNCMKEISYSFEIARPDAFFGCVAAQ